MSLISAGSISLDSTFKGLVSLKFLRPWLAESQPAKGQKQFKSEVTDLTLLRMGKDRKSLTIFSG